MARPMPVAPPVTTARLSTRSAASFAVLDGTYPFSPTSRADKIERTKTKTNFATPRLFDFVYFSPIIRRMTTRSFSPFQTARAGEKTDPGRLPAQVRQARLVEAVHERGFIGVAAVAAELGVSEMTIRRDLAELERDGQLIRTHGGALALEGVGDHAIDREEPAFEARLRRNQDAKARIATAAAMLIDAAQTVALDVGTTTFLLAQ